VIYVDTSVVLAELLAEDRRLGAMFWNQDLVASRLLEFETWNAIRGRGLVQTHMSGAVDLLNSIRLFEITAPIVTAPEIGSPVRTRTLDTIHLATFRFIQRRVPELALATYDARMAEAARAERFALYPLA